MAEKSQVLVLKDMDVINCAFPMFKKHGIEFVIQPLNAHGILNKNQEKERAQSLAACVKNRVQYNLTDVAAIIVFLPIRDLPSTCEFSKIEAFIKSVKQFFYSFFEAFHMPVNIILGGFSVSQGQGKVRKLTQTELSKKLDNSYFPGTHNRMSFVDISSPFVPYASEAFFDKGPSPNWQTNMMLGCILIAKEIALAS